MRIATWNINSVRLRLGLVLDFIKQFDPDVLCLQEIKCAEDQFPEDEIRAAGLDHIFVNGQRSYHGVATCSRLPGSITAKWDLNDSGHARHLATELKPGPRKSPVEIHNYYVPAGGDEPDPDKNPKFQQKLTYLDQMAKVHGDQGPSGRARRILVGDLNVAPSEHDVWSHKQLLKVVSHTPVETKKLGIAQDAHDWIDVVRASVPDDEVLYSWWSYRARDWRASNRGRRLDHVWASPPLAKKVGRVEIFQAARDWEKPSDHVPVIVDFDL